MPFPLSSLDFIQFTTDYPQYNALSPSFAMQSGQTSIVNWNNSGRIVLVWYDPSETITVNDNVYPSIYYTDVTDSSQLAALENPNYVAPPQSMLDTLPQAIKDTIAGEATAAGAMVNQVGQTLAVGTDFLSKTVGTVAGNLTQPLLSNLTPVLIGGLVLLFLFYGPKRQ
jgi:hypothetical protein